MGEIERDDSVLSIRDDHDEIYQAIQQELLFDNYSWPEG